VPEESPISREFVSSVKMKLAARRGGKPSAAATRAGYGGFQEAASVLASFQVESLKPVPDAPSKDTREELISVSVPLMGRYWTLRPEIRIAALRQLRETQRTEAALEANPRRYDDPLQVALTAYLTGSGSPVGEQSLVEVTAVRQVAAWVRAAGFSGVPEMAAIERRAEWLKLLQPFEHLAGNFFRGRASELTRLRSYVGIVPPGSRIETVRRSFVEFFTGKSPLLIYGPGGVGKSTLVSRFILEHARALEADRFPFAYLDFDRPEITAAEPLTLLIEAVRQLGIEYPDAQERCERVRQGWLKLYRPDRPKLDPGGTEAAPAIAVTPEQLSVAVRDFASLVSSVNAYRPVVMVLDTFEEVQWKSDEQVAAIWRMLEELQTAVGRLCLVVVGRAPVPARKTEEMELKSFDTEAAIGYLFARGISAPGLAAQIAKLIGGNPMNIQLAADLVLREGIQSGAELGISTREYLFLRMGDAQVQRQLYDRVLDHIHDERVRRIARPGLVLRRITPELIFEVLNRPCGLGLTKIEEAKPLFEEFWREVSLVRRDSDGALVNRTELRLEMLPLLHQDEPQKAAEIHQAAVDYYERRPPKASDRAEEIYHRLCLGEDRALVSNRWMLGVEPYLQDAFDEFTGDKRAYLAARLGREIDAGTRGLADLEDWEDIVRRKVADLLAHGEPEPALDMLSGRPDRTSKSPLYALEAEALRRLGRWEESFGVLDRGIAEALRHGHREQALSLELQAADMVLANRREHYPQWLVPRIEAMSESNLRPEDRMALTARKVALAIIDFPFNLPEHDLWGQLRRAFDTLSDEDLARRPDIGWWAVIGFQLEDVPRLARVIRYSGLPRTGVELELRELATQITSFDVAVSRERGEPQGSLARVADVPVSGSLTTAWSEFLLTASKAKVEEALSRLLAAHATSMPDAVVRAFADLMRAGVGMAPRAPTRPRESAPSSDVRGASIQTTAKLSDALLRRFPTASDLAEFLASRRSWSLDSIARDGPLRLRVLEVVVWANSMGQLLELVESARQANPADAELSEIAAEMGIQTLAPRASELEGILRHGQWGLPWFREQLGLIEGKVCRVEIAEKPSGTAFLVGPDLILTARHVLEPVYNGKMRPGDIRLRFDYRIANDRVLSEGTLFPLADEWLVSSDEQDGLDYSLMRARNSPGAQPIGGARAESSAALRNWLKPGGESFAPNEQLIIVQHGMSGSLRLALGTVLEPGGNGEPYFTYDANTGPGSSGSPCFTGDLRLIGMQLGTRGRANYGARISAIMEDLGRRNLGHLMGSQLA